MKRVRNLVIGGIQSKIFNLILYTVILLTAANIGVTVYQAHTLSKLAAESVSRYLAIRADNCSRLRW